MRSFDDAAGRHWQAALMQASFGNVLVIFSRIGGDEVLAKSLDTADYEEAGRVLADAREERLCELLTIARPFP